MIFLDFRGPPLENLLSRGTQGLFPKQTPLWGSVKFFPRKVAKLGGLWRVRTATTAKLRFSREVSVENFFFWPDHPAPPLRGDRPITPHQIGRAHV